MKRFLPLAVALLLISGCATEEDQPQPTGGAYRVYVTNETSGDLSIIDPPTRQVVGRVPLGKRPRGIVASPDNRLLYIALSGSPISPPGVDESTLPPADKAADGIAVFDVASGKVLRVLRGISDPEQVALSPDGVTVYVASEDTGRVMFMDAKQGGIRKTMVVGGEPEGLASSPDGALVYATSEEDSTIAVIDAKEGTVRTRVPVGKRPRNIVFAPAGDRAFVPGENDASVVTIDVPTSKVVQRVILAGENPRPMGIAVTPGGDTLFVTTGRGGRLVKLAAANLKVTGETAVGERPWGVALSPDFALPLHRQRTVQRRDDGRCTDNAGRRSLRRRGPALGRCGGPAKVRRSVLLSVLMLSGAEAVAQDADIIVTGRGLDAGLGEEVYGEVIIGRERLTSSASGQLEEVLRDVPGFQLFRRSDARSANPTSQGATLRALGGNASSRALLLLDGVPQTDPFGGWISWPAYDPQRLGQVRVVRGGGSGVNGPGALAGTIELSSALPEEVRGLTAGLAYGSRNSIDAYAGYGAVLGGGFAMLSGSFGRGDGFIPIVEDQRGPIDQRSPYEQASVALRVAAPLAESVELQGSGLVFSDKRERGTPLSDISTTGADASLRLVGNGAWRWSALAYLQTRDFYNSFASVSDDRTSAIRVAEQYNVPSTGLGARVEVRPPLGEDFELRLGGDWRETDGQTQERFNFQNGVGTRRRIAGGRTTTLGAFAELAWESDPLTLTAGGRIDRWLIQDGFLDERVFATGQVLTDTQFDDRSGWEPTARAGFAWRPAGAVTIRGAAYLGWRLPTLNELYRPFRVGPDATAANAVLDPERLEGVELGADYRPLSTARIGVTVFANRLKDGIANVTLGQGPGVFPGVGFVAAGGQFRQRQNLDSIEAKGIEIDAALELGTWSLSGGYSYVDAEVHASGAALPLDGLRPAQTPRHSASTTVAWRSARGARAALSAHYVGNQFEDDLGEQVLPDALSFDAVAQWPLTRALAIEARAENFTNERIVATISSDGIIERARPRTFWIGLRYGD